MNKVAIIGAVLAFVIPIGLVVGIGASGTDINSLLGEGTNAGSIPSGKLYYFYAPR